MYTGPKIIKTGLTFGYDTGDNPSSNFDHKKFKRRYFRGKSTVNVVTNTNLDTGWSKGYQTAVVFDEIAPPKRINSPVVGFNKNSSSSYWYSYGDYAPQTPGTTYTVSMYVKTRDSNFRIRFYTANNSETGRVWGSYITVPNDGRWHRVVWPSFINPSNSQSDSLSFNFVMADTGDSSRTWFCAPQMEANSYVTPFVTGTRSSTNVLIDLNKTITIDSSTASYNSDGLPTFDGTGDYIAVTGGGISNYSSPFTYECVFKASGTWANERVSNIVANGGSYAGIYGIGKSGTNTLNFVIRDASYHAISTNVADTSAYHHAVGVWDQSNSQMRFYVDGELAGTVSSVSKTGATDTANLFIGGRRAFGGSVGSYYQGEIPVVKFYNEALTPVQVIKNYRAYKTGLQTASYIQFNNVEGLTNFSSSIQERIASQEGFSSSLSTTELIYSGSFSGSFIGDGSQLSGVTSYTDADTLAYINSVGVISSSAQIASDVSGSFTDLSQSLAGRVLANEEDIDSLLAATASYALEANISGAFTSVSQSIATDISNIIDGTTTVTSASYALTASYADNFNAVSASLDNISTTHIDFDTTAEIDTAQHRLFQMVHLFTLLAL